MRKTSIEEIEMVDSYINSEMSTGEKQDFETRLHNDEHLQKVLRASIAINRAVQRENLREQISYLAQQHKRYKLRKQITYTFSLSAILIAVIISAYWFFNDKKTAPTKLYASYYSSYEPQVYFRGETDENAIRQAIKLYSQKQYGKSIEILQPMALQKIVSDEVSFYMGLNLLEQGVKRAEAVPYLTNVMNGKSAYKQSACWYLAMYYLKANQPDLAKVNLKKLTQTNNYYTKQAIKLIEQL